ncbi:MAG: uridylate kinase [Chloroflexi bacterium]|jgi:isopentenyl phosphate kinase|uniref:Isopentenyl phosphate kinase n=1 Tax=Candidatus Thermofonsia Clade 3 bacterium TaxID=2364212 RepID=A0A2M8QCB3_9CHLR|nr:isopentenyl phosphate kinase [Candidatus Roseilinea sp. NK_OTU-006]PJF47453.1 MAG: uridylate kinase [Candidatus Thermofonsia Clade 3 bacterium]RMG65336.1 MAG: uridylate kinase [Chloroflexota bacterium]
MIFLKLGGSLITDKTQANTPRLDVIRRLAKEIGDWRLEMMHRQSPISALSLLLGHGSGSFGHAAAKRYGTRAGVRDAEGWRGFAEVSVAAARLNRIVADALHEAGVPVISFCPSASARCVDGRLVYLDVAPIRAALDHGIVPLVMGDVAFDDRRGGTIVSTEEVFAYLAHVLSVTQVLLAGETAGVYRGFEPQSRGDMNRFDIIPRITPLNWDEIRGGVGGSHGADVTGGMASKVHDMLALVTAHPTVTVRIFSGLIEGNVARALRGEPIGTEIIATDDARLVGPGAPVNV